MGFFACAAVEVEAQLDVEFAVAGLRDFEWERFDRCEEGLGSAVDVKCGAKGRAS